MLCGMGVRRLTDWSLWLVAFLQPSTATQLFGSHSNSLALCTPVVRNALHTSLVATLGVQIAEDSEQGAVVAAVERVGVDAFARNLVCVVRPLAVALNRVLEAVQGMDTAASNTKVALLAVQTLLDVAERAFSMAATVQLVLSRSRHPSALVLTAAGVASLDVCMRQAVVLEQLQGDATSPGSAVPPAITAATTGWMHQLLVHAATIGWLRHVAPSGHGAHAALAAASHCLTRVLASEAGTSQLAEAAARVVVSGGAGVLATASVQALVTQLLAASRQHPAGGCSPWVLRVVAALLAAPGVRLSVVAARHVLRLVAGTLEAAASDEASSHAAVNSATGLLLRVLDVARSDGALDVWMLPEAPDVAAALVSAPLPTQVKPSDGLPVAAACAQRVVAAQRMLAGRAAWPLVVSTAVAAVIKAGVAELLAATGLASVQSASAKQLGAVQRHLAAAAAHASGQDVADGATVSAMARALAVLPAVLACPALDASVAPLLDCLVHLLLADTPSSAGVDTLVRVQTAAWSVLRRSWRKGDPPGEVTALVLRWVRSWLRTATREGAEVVVWSTVQANVVASVLTPEGASKVKSSVLVAVATATVTQLATVWHAASNATTADAADGNAAGDRDATLAMEAEAVLAATAARCVGQLSDDYASWSDDLVYAVKAFIPGVVAAVGRNVAQTPRPATLQLAATLVTAVFSFGEEGGDVAMDDGGETKGTEGAAEPAEAALGEIPCEPRALFNALLPASMSHTQPRDVELGCLRLLLAMARGQPKACCSRTSLRVVLRGYSASITAADLLRMQLLTVHEESGVTLASVGFKWGAASSTTRTTRAASLSQSFSWFYNATAQGDGGSGAASGGLLASRVKATLVHYPASRGPVSGDGAVGEAEGVDAPHAEEVYDPMFMLPLLNHLLTTSEVPVRTFTASGALTLAVASLSSAVKSVRQLAYAAVAQYLELLAGDAEGFRERPQVELVLRVVQASVPAPFARLPALVCLFVAEALDVALKPTHAHYQVINSFLLKKPTLDLNDVPLFYTMFNHGGQHHRARRSWLLNYLGDGVQGVADHHALARRHVYGILMTYASSCVADTTTRLAVLRVRYHHLCVGVFAVCVAVWLYGCCLCGRGLWVLRVADRVWCVFYQVLTNAAGCQTTLAKFLAKDSPAPSKKGDAVDGADAGADAAADAATNDDDDDDDDDADSPLVNPAALYLWRHAGVLPWLVAMCEASTTPVRVFADAIALVRAVFDAAASFALMSHASSDDAGRASAGTRQRVAAVVRDFGTAASGLLSAAVARVKRGVSPSDARSGHPVKDVLVPAVALAERVAAVSAEYVAGAKRGNEGSMPALQAAVCPMDVLDELSTVAGRASARATTDLASLRTHTVSLALLCGGQGAASAVAPQDASIDALLRVATFVLGAAAESDDAGLAARCVAWVVRLVDDRALGGRLYERAPAAFLQAVAQLCQHTPGDTAHDSTWPRARDDAAVAGATAAVVALAGRVYQHGGDAVDACVEAGVDASAAAAATAAAAAVGVASPTTGRRGAAVVVEHMHGVRSMALLRRAAAESAAAAPSTPVRSSLRASSKKSAKKSSKKSAKKSVKKSAKKSKKRDRDGDQSMTTPQASSAKKTKGSRSSKSTSKSRKSKKQRVA